LYVYKALNYTVVFNTHKWGDKIWTNFLSSSINGK